MTIRPSFHLKSLLLCLLLIVGQFAQASFCQGQEKHASGTNSRSVRKEAQRNIPYNQLTAETRKKLTPIIDKPSLYRRLPITSIDVDPDMFLFLIRQPEVVVNIWQLMGVTQMTVERTGPFKFLTNDGAGAVSNVELIYGTNKKHIYYAEGDYSGPLLKRKLRGRAVMVLNTEYSIGPGGKPKTTNSLDVFLKVENATVNLVAKTLNPIIGPTADHNFAESLKFVQRLNETTESNGTGVQRMAYRLTSLTDKVRDQFIEVAGTVYERNSRRTTMKPAAGAPGNPAKPSPVTRSSYSPMQHQSGIPVRRASYQDFGYGFK